MTRSILHAFSTFDLGGSQSRFLRLVPKLNPGYRHLVLAMDGRFGALQTYRAIHSPEQVPALERLDMQVIKGAGIANLGSMRALLREHAPARVVSYNWGAIEWALACALSRTAHVHVEDGFGPEESLQRLMRRNLGRFGMLTLSAAPVVVPSRTLERIALQEWHLRRRKVHLIPNGIDVASIPTRAERTGPSRFARDSNEIIVGTIAGLRPEKNLSALIAAIVCDARIRLIIAGDGAQRDALLDLAGQLGLAHRVELLGHRDDAASLYQHFDIYAISSITEQLPMSLLEAMVSGLPVAATAVGDIAASVSPENRHWIVPDAGADLARALAELAADETLRIRLGQSNQALARQQFDDHTMVAAWSALITP